MKDVVSGSLALDAMGSDMGSLEVVKGLKIALDALEATPDQGPIIVVGKEDELKSAFAETGISEDERVKIVHAPDVIAMDEKPMNAIKKKRKSSMMVALDLVKEGQAKAVLSCGNTGSLMGGGTIKLRPMQGIERPALATIIPGIDKFTVLIDSGANPDSTPVHLTHNAVLGSNFAKVVLGIEEPRVGLLTIGTEEGKGGERIIESNHMLKSVKGIIRYDGLVEGYDLFDGDVDVIVCDGFVGNVVLKASESLFHAVGGFLKKELTASPVRKMGGLLAKGAFTNLKNHFSPAEYGSAPLLGLKAPVFKAHGSSNRDAIAGGIKIALNVIQHDMTERILDDIKSVNRMILPSKSD